MSQTIGPVTSQKGPVCLAGGFGPVYGPNTPAFVLDQLSAFPAVAFSVRQLTAGQYARPYCMLVRRSSDNATLNIGYVNGVLDVVSLLAFVGSGNGFVVTWYNQGSLGSAGDAMQSTASNQPQIVASGVVETVNGVPAVYFGGSQNLNFSPSGLPSGSSSSSLVWVGSVSSLAGNGLIWYGNSATNQQRALSTYTSNGVFWVSDQGSNILNGTPTAGKPFIGTGLFGNSLLQGYFNGASTGSTAAALVTSLVYGQIGQNASIGGNQTGYAIEMMIVPALMSASDRAIYDVNVATFAGISGMTQ